MHANWSYPTKILFGSGRIAELSAACTAIGCANPLIVTDKILATLPLLQTVCTVLADAHIKYAVFSAVDANPTEQNLTHGCSKFLAGNHDGVIALGGGSGIDVAKLVALMAKQTIDVWQLEDIDDWWQRANANVIAPIIAVPTTAGTGSEVGRSGILTNSATATKKIIFHPNIMPRIVIADAQLTVSMPPQITAGTGMDAFAHCLEAYCTKTFHPMSQGIAIEGMRLVKENLLAAYTDGSNLVAREQMLIAASMGAVAFQKGLGAIHAVSHPIGAIYHAHHGTTNAVFIQPVLAMNRSVIHPRIAALAAYLQIDGGFDGFCEYVGTLNHALGIPKSISALLGTDDIDIDTIVAAALQDPCAASNPVAMTVANTTRLLEACW